MALAPVAVIGVGNRMRRDDGVGPAVLDQLRAQDGAELTAELLELDGEATRLVDAWRERRLAIVVDAGRAGAEPGSIHRIEVGIDEVPGWSATASSHSAGLAEAIALGRALDALPPRLIVMGVEPADLSWGEGLSPAVAAAVPAAVDRVLVELAG